MRKLVYICAIIFSSSGLLRSQETIAVPPQELPSQNLVKFNRFLVNPTFSLVGQEQSYISIFNRNQWVQFDDSPQLYLLNYSSKYSERAGVAIGAYQQSNGVFNYFGINANYAYAVPLNREMSLTFGSNLAYFQSGLASDTNAAQQDPLLLGFDELSSFSLNPGVNLSYNDFDIGMYAENLVTYDLKNNELVQDAAAFAGHLMYTREFGYRNGNQIRGLIQGKKAAEREFELSGSVLLDVKKLGWVQAGYSDYYGGHAGVGAHITDNISIGYSIERSFKNGPQNLGASHEITMAYRFGTPNTNRFVNTNKKEKEAEERYAAQQNEDLEKLRRRVEDNADLINKMLSNQDSLALASNERSENQLKQLVAMMKTQEAAREQQRLEDLALQSEAYSEPIYQDEEQGIAQEENYMGPPDALRAPQDYYNQDAYPAEETYQETNDPYGQQTQNGQPWETGYTDSGNYANSGMAQNGAQNYIPQQQGVPQPAYTNPPQNGYSPQGQSQAYTQNYYQQNSPYTNLPQNGGYTTAGPPPQAPYYQNQPSQNTAGGNGNVTINIFPNRNPNDVTINIGGQGGQGNTGAISTQNYQNPAGASPNGYNTTPQNNQGYPPQGGHYTNYYRDPRQQQPQYAYGNRPPQRKQYQYAEGSMSPNSGYNQGETQYPPNQGNSTLEEIYDNNPQVITNEKRYISEGPSYTVNKKTYRGKKKPKWTTEYIDNYESGYYVIGAVTRLRSAANSMASRLRGLGFQEARAIFNPRDKAYYIAIKRYSEGEQATRAYYTDIDGRYMKDKWLLNLKGKKPISRIVNREVPEATKSLKMITYTSNDLNGQRPGYYLIVDVFKEASNATRFLKMINSKGYEQASIIQNPFNDYKYVAVKRYDSKQDTERGYRIDVEDKFKDPIWILNVTNGTNSVATTTNDKKAIEEYASAKANENEQQQASVPAAAVAKKSTPSRRAKKGPRWANKKIPNHKPGYYVIGAVTSNANGAERFVNRLKTQGYDEAQAIYNPENGSYYVALSHYDYKNDASRAYSSNMDGTYYNDMWLLGLTNPIVTKVANRDDPEDQDLIKQTFNREEAGGLTKGYYMIVNVFSKEPYYEKFMKELRAQNLEPKSFKNPRNNYRYVYLERYDSFRNAKTAYNTKMQNTYNKEIWILKVR